ncbi:hypothetical protein G9F72_006645 [Clostridium estertheticum]|nr:hypothetical protein [Clostridium estertheticum]MBZ9686012.1 hypothetical protein [Clostridium estertheticum]
MRIRTEFDFNIEENEIIRLFGYKDSEPGDYFKGVIVDNIRTTSVG